MAEDYYTQNVNALLFMGASTATPLPAPGSDTFTEVPLTQVLAPPQWEQSVGTFNVTNDGNRRSVGGKLSEQSITGTIVRASSEATHAAMFADVKVVGGQKRNWYLEWPDGMREDFVSFVSRIAPAAFDATGDAQPHVFEFTLSVDNAVTQTP
jgi:hypothetical protein